MEKPGRVSDQKWCCSQTFDLLRAASRYWKAFHQVHIWKSIRIIPNLESLLNWEPSRKGLRIRRGYVVLNCRMFWQACTYIHIYSILHKHHVKSFYIVLRSTYITFRYTAWSKYQSLAHLTTFPWHYLQKIHLMHLHIQRTCCWRKPATNQALAAFLLPRSDGRIPHLRSQSSYIWLHLLYFNDISMCFKDFCQIGSLERRHIDIACAKSLKSPSKACRKQEIPSSPSFRFLHLAELSSLSFWLSEILKKGAASSLLCLLWLGLIQVGFGHLFPFAFDSFWFCLAPNELQYMTIFDYHDLPLTHNISDLSANSNPCSWQFNADKPLDSKRWLQHFGQSTLQMNLESVWTPDQCYDIPPDEWSMMINVSSTSLLWLAARNIFGALYWKTELGTCSCHVASAKKTEIAQIRLPWGWHDFSLHVWFLRFSNDFFAGGQPNLQEKRSTVPPRSPHEGASLGSRCLDGTCLSSNLLLALRCIENCGTKAPEYMTGNLFKVEAAKLLQNSDQSISITRTTHTSLSGHVVRYGNT